MPKNKNKKDRSEIKYGLIFTSCNLHKNDVKSAFSCISMNKGSHNTRQYQIFLRKTFIIGEKYVLQQFCLFFNIIVCNFGW